MTADSLAALQAPPVYRRHPGRGDMVYRDLCRVLSGRLEEVTWGDYRPEDWQLLAMMGRPENEGVGPLVYWQLKEAWPQVMPEAVRRNLEGSYYKTVAHNTLLLGELNKILPGLEKAGIEVVVLKGAAFFGSLYTDLGQRPMGDLDLLVAQSQVARAGKAIQSLGYFPEQVDPALHPHFRETFHIEAHFHKNGNPKSLVELHWDLLGGATSQLRVDLGWFNDRLTSFEGEGRPVNNALVLNPEANILFLTGHLMLKHWMLKPAGEKHARLLWFYDVFRLSELYGEEIAWQSVYSAAKAFNWDLAFLGALYGAYARFGNLGADDFIARQFRDLNPRALERVKTLGLLQDQRNYRFVQMKPLAALKYFWLHLFPSPAYIRWRYRPRPTFIWPLFYPIRWFLGIRKGLLQLQGRET